MRVSPKAARRAGSRPARASRPTPPPAPDSPPGQHPQEACTVPQPAAHVCPRNRAPLRAHRAIAGSGISKPFPGPSDFRGGRPFRAWFCRLASVARGELAVFCLLALQPLKPRRLPAEAFFSSASPVLCLGMSRTMETRGPHEGCGHATRSHNGPLSPSEEAALCPEYLNSLCALRCRWLCPGRSLGTDAVSGFWPWL